MHSTITQRVWAKKQYTAGKNVINMFSFKKYENNGYVLITDILSVW